MNWTQIDTFGQAVQRFTGTEAALRKHLLTGIEDAGRITSNVEELYLAKLKAKVKRTVITLTTPWGEWRYISE